MWQSLAFNGNRSKSKYSFNNSHKETLTLKKKLSTTFLFCFYFSIFRLLHYDFWLMRWVRKKAPVTRLSSSLRKEP